VPPEAPTLEASAVTSTPAPASPSPRRTLRRRAAKLYTPSQKAQILEHAAVHGITEASKAFGVSRFTIYDCPVRVQPAGSAQFKNVSEPIDLFEIRRNAGASSHSSIDPVCRMRVDPTAAPAIATGRRSALTIARRRR
jgi:hypothetical protein